MRERACVVVRRCRRAARRAAGEAAGRGSPSRASAHRFGDRAIAHEHRVHRGAEEALDEQRRRLIGADEIAQRAEHRAVAELLALAQQTRGGGRETDALALERVERVDLALQRRVRLVGAEQLRARDATSRSRVSRSSARAASSAARGLRRARARFVDC